ncbi:MAG TPA: hypothetical protein VK085_09870 [Pseudogracilibacillus sp.]|nr:hypothetical protein [Pseudogracilibacillus sp.]
MSTIHYFQRYSQKENMVTNNTMLLFSRLYHHSTNQFNQFLKTLLQESDDFNHEEFDSTIKFLQQTRGKKSVPDAVIEQQSFKIIIETKLYGQENMKQLKNHCQSFNQEDWQLLLLINNEKMDESYKQKVVTLLNEMNEARERKITFASTTFKEICTYFKEVLTDFDREMHDLIDDYEAFCTETRLIDNAGTKMRAVSVGNTLKQNLAYNLYYAPTGKYQNHKYLGLYKGKAVRAIGEIISIADISYNMQEDIITIDTILLGDITEKQKEDVKQVMMEAKEKYGYFIAQGHRFFFVEKFIETTFKKMSKDGLISRKYFDLTDIEGYSKKMNTEELASLLKEVDW